MQKHFEGKTLQLNSHWDTTQRPLETDLDSNHLALQVHDLY